MRAAVEEDRILITADSDFAAMLAIGALRAPSVVLLRSADHMRPSRQAEFLVANLATVGEELARGAIVSLTRLHARVRELPIDPGD